MPRFFKKNEAAYWDRFPEHLKDMSQILADSKLTPATMHVMGDPSDESAPTALIFTTPPGE